MVVCSPADCQAGPVQLLGDGGDGGGQPVVVRAVAGGGVPGGVGPAGAGLLPHELEEVGVVKLGPGGRESRLVGAHNYCDDLEKKSTGQSWAVVGGGQS